MQKQAQNAKASAEGRWNEWLGGASPCTQLQGLVLWLVVFWEDAALGGVARRFCGVMFAQNDGGGSAE